MKKITFNIPTVDGIETRQGYIVWLSAGPWKRRFVLQCSENGSKNYVLADYATGYVVYSGLPGRMLSRYVGRPYAYDSSLAAWRREAQSWINEAVDRKGLSRIQAMLSAVPVINGIDNKKVTV